MCFFVSNLFGVVAAAIQGGVDCEDYVSHLLVLPPFYVAALMRI
jgi:hypothetical protein